LIEFCERLPSAAKAEAHFSVYGTIEIVPFQNTAMKLQETLGSKQEKARLGAGLLISGFLTAACGSSTVA
jgi:hypothetical protein